MKDQYELISTVCSRPQQFAWFLGAGTSAVAGLPTATDIIWDLKRRYYCREENQEISRQDFQMDAVKARIQSYMLSRSFPREGDPGEYTTYFEKIFGSDKEKQRQYLAAILSEDSVTLSVGNRVLGALLGTGQSRAVFTTNFDSVIERAVAEVAGRSLSAYHLEGATSANKALNREEYPLYCKLHGDFRYDSIKNLKSDLAAQNADLSQCLVNAVNRFGLIIAGYSGRDDSIIELLRSVLSTSNPFPHGLFWTYMKNGTVLPVVRQLINDAKGVGVDAALVEVETFDAFMLRLWRNVENKDPAIDTKVRKSQLSTVSIPQSPPGRGAIVRMNALPITRLPGECQALTFGSSKEWSDLRAATRNTQGGLIFTKSDTVLCWGKETVIREQFSDVVSISAYDISTKIADIENNLHIKGFLEEAVCHALIRGKPLLTRTTREASFLIADARGSDQSAFGALRTLVGATCGEIAGLFAPVDAEHPNPAKVAWAESVRVSIVMVDGRCWLLLDPDVWIWPNRARKNASDFLDERRGERYNNVYNGLVDAWLSVLLGDSERNAEVKISTFEGGTIAETPSFTVGTRTGYTRRLAS
jgi:hypothetical protein